MFVVGSALLCLVFSGGWLGERYRAVFLQRLQDGGTKGPGASSGVLRQVKHFFKKGVSVVMR